MAYGCLRDVRGRTKVNLRWRTHGLIDGLLEGAGLSKLLFLAIDDRSCGLKFLFDTHHLNGVSFSDNRSFDGGRFVNDRSNVLVVFGLAFTAKFLLLLLQGLA